MQVKITYLMSATIDGTDIQEIKQKWEDMNLSPSPNHEYRQFVSATDLDTLEEVSLN